MSNSDLTEIEYHEQSLNQIIRWYVEDYLKHDDWRLVSVDTYMDKVVLKRYEFKEDTS